MLEKSDIKAFIGEFICTFIFIFVLGGAALNQTGGALVTALLATAIIYAFGSISGAHFNPAVTLGAIIGKKINPLKGAIYMVLQVLAGICAIGVLFVMFPDGAIPKIVIKPTAGIMAALLMEFILTFILVFIIYLTAMGVRTEPSETDPESGAVVASNKQRLLFAPIAIGFTLGFLCAPGGRISGGAFNPAVATGPAIWALDVKNLWIYWVGDMAGGAAAALVYIILFGN